MLTAVYVCVIPKSLSGADEKRLLDMLPVFRREKAEKYIHSRDRILSAAVWHLLRRATYEVSGFDAFSLAVQTNELRKPSFAVDIGVHFSLSHCQNAAVCAVSRYECGVDIEPLLNADLEIARRFMPDRYDALMGIADHEGRNDFFTQMWTEYESVYKTRVTKEGSMPEGYRIYRFRKDIYYIALCAKASAGRVKLVEADLITYL